MGARPEFFLLSIGFSAEKGEDFPLAVARGALSRALPLGVDLVGGDLSVCAADDRLRSRSGGARNRGRRCARAPSAGDLLFVTGFPGRAAAGLSLARGLPVAPPPAGLAPEAGRGAPGRLQRPGAPRRPGARALAPEPLERGDRRLRRDRGGRRAAGARLGTARRHREGESSRSLPPWRPSARSGRKIPSTGSSAAATTTSCSSRRRKARAARSARSRAAKSRSPASAAWRRRGGGPARERQGAGHLLSRPRPLRGGGRESSTSPARSGAGSSTP